jgi:hypothetical protein
MTQQTSHGYRVAIFIADANQYMFMHDKLKDGNPYFVADRLAARRIANADEAHDIGDALAEAYETTYIIEPWYETGRDSA